MAASIKHLFDEERDIQSIKQMSEAIRDGGDLSHQAVLDFFNKASSIVQNLPVYDVIGMNDLVGRLRAELKNIHGREDGIDSLNKLSAKINVSRTYLAKFRDGGAVCMNIMNRIAGAFKIRYLIENYHEEQKKMIE